MKEKEQKQKESFRENYLDVYLRKEMEESYLDYAMSVIISRALPDVRDGLKPAQRRILYAMYNLGLTQAAKFRKSAAVVGEVIAKYHPHGDFSIYEALVRCAQDFSLRYPLIIGQGNFGCFTKDTKIKLTDGRDLNFEELIKEHQEGKRNYTYTINNLGLISIAEIENPRLTKKDAEVIKITLDNGEEIKCTPNHLFMLKDNTYKEAQYLGPKDFLMSFYQKFSEKTDNNHKVIKIENTKKKEDVFDLTIKNTHNFCLTAGVFVHNSIDGDPAAAHRYTEVKMSALAEEILEDLEKETVKFIPNYDGTLQEPVVLPSKLPNLILNGTVGIAVGVATNIPPHNLTEVCEAIIALIERPQATIDELMKFIKGPDFPTGGLIINPQQIKEIYTLGRGGLTVRAKTEVIEISKDHWQILVSEIPYQVNKSVLLEKIAELVKNKKIEEIREIKDLSSREGIKIILDLKKNSQPQKILNRLFVLSSLQETFHFNFVALKEGIQPRSFSFKNLLEEYIKHRQVIIKKRTVFDLHQTLERIHLLFGFKIVWQNIEKVIYLIKKSKDREEAKTNLKKKIKLSERQAVAVLEMRLQQLVNLERERILNELKEKQKLAKELKEILSQPKKILEIIKQEVSDLKNKYGDKRRTQIISQPIQEITSEDFIPDEPTIIVTTKDKYIKRIAPQNFRVQNRGGKGVIALITKKEDLVEHLSFTSSHADLLIFTTRGRVFKLKVYEIPVSSRLAKGQALVNFLPITPEEKISTLLSFKTLEKNNYLVMVTKFGLVKRLKINFLERVRRSGLVVINLMAGDSLKWVKATSGEDEIILVSRSGQSIRFREKEVREMGREARGVRGIKLKNNDQIIGADVLKTKLFLKEKESFKLLVVSEKGFGKQSDLKLYRQQRRGGSGLKTFKVSKKTGWLTFALVINEKELADNFEGDLIIISQKGQSIRLPITKIPSLNRVTQGVYLMRLKESTDIVVSASLI